MGPRVTETSYTAWDGNLYEWPPPDGWYEAADGKWWPEGYGPPVETAEPEHLVESEPDPDPEVDPDPDPDPEVEVEVEVEVEPAADVLRLFRWNGLC